MTKSDVCDHPDMKEDAAMAETDRVLAQAAIGFIEARYRDVRLGAVARHYLEDMRGVKRSVVKLFGVGLYSAGSLRDKLKAAGFEKLEANGFGLIRPAFEDWLAFPWFDADRVLKGFVFRALPDTLAQCDRLGRPLRYAFCGDRDNLPLYGLASARPGNGRRLIVVESTIGLMVLRSHDIKDSIAANSCQLRVWHAVDLVRKGISEIVLCLDADAPGRRGTIKSIEACAAAGLSVQVAPLLPGNADAEDFVRLNGAAAFRDALAASECGFAYAARHRLADSTAADQSERLADAADFHTLRPPGRDASYLDQRFWPKIVEGLRVSRSEIEAAVSAAYARRIAERGLRGLPTFSP